MLQFARAARRVSAVASLVFVVAVPRMASAQFVNFESLGYTGTCQGGGGGGFTTLAGTSLTWNGFRPLDLVNFKDVCGVSGPNGYSSLLPANVGKVVALGSGAAIVNSVNPFVLTSFVGGAGWINPTKLKLEYFLNTVKQGESVLNFNVTQTGASMFSGLFAGATDQITFTPDYGSGVDEFNSAAQSCAGVPQPCVGQPYQSWFLDNMTFIAAPAVVVAPEPATLGLLAGGLLAVGGFARRRRKQ